jgi:hypothetical protein
MIGIKIAVGTPGAFNDFTLDNLRQLFFGDDALKRWLSG